MNNHREKLERLKDLSKTLDSKFEGPMGIRFGLDALLGLIPGVGDFITSAISVYIIAQAAAMGVGPATLIRMAINVGIENLMDMIPLFGNLFDFYWKANNKNMALLENHLQNPSRETIKSRMIVALICVILLLVLLGSAYISFLVIKSLFYWITTTGAD